MININNVTKIYPVRRNEQQVKALNGVTLSIDRGDIFGIVGHSGAGKSTLLRLLNGLEIPTSGSVLVDGNEISSLKSKDLRIARQKIGMIFQHFHLLWSRTVRENIAFPLEVAGKSKKEIDAKVEQLLDRVGLTERGDAYPAQLSGGQKQRVGIARAIANEPDVLLCDEATSALDPETTSSILRLLKQIHQETGITLVLITHEMSVVRAICNKMAVMEGGLIVETGEVETIFRQPKHPVTQQFVKELNIGNEGIRQLDTGKTIQVSLEKLSLLKQLATQHTVTFQIVNGLVSSDSGNDLVTVVVKGDPEQVCQAVGQLEAEVMTDVE